MQELRFPILKNKKLFYNFKGNFLLKGHDYDNLRASKKEITIDLAQNERVRTIEKEVITGTEEDFFGDSIDVISYSYLDIKENFYDDYLPKKIDELVEIYKKLFIHDLDGNNI